MNGATPINGPGLSAAHSTYCVLTVAIYSTFITAYKYAGSHAWRGWRGVSEDSWRVRQLSAELLSQVPRLGGKGQLSRNWRLMIDLVVSYSAVSLLVTVALHSRTNCLSSSCWHGRGSVSRFRARRCAAGPSHSPPRPGPTTSACCSSCKRRLTLNTRCR